MGAMLKLPSRNADLTSMSLWPFKAGMSLAGRPYSALTSPVSRALTCWGPVGTSTKVIPER